MDAITLLKADHKAAAKLAREFSAAQKSEDPKRDQIVNEMIGALSVHMTIEEQIFYPAIRREVPGIDNAILESIEEHHVLRWTLAELAEMKPTDERYDAKVTVLVEHVRHHVKEEEEDWFPKVRRRMSRTRLSELGSELEAAKPGASRTPQPQSVGSRR